jgi:hypothetical protein
LQDSIECIGVPGIVLVEVTIAIGSDHNRAMAHPAREHVEAHTSRNRERGIGVAHIVKADVGSFARRSSASNWRSTLLWLSGVPFSLANTKPAVFH